MTILTPDIVQLDYVDRKTAWQSKRVFILSEIKESCDQCIVLS